MGLEEVVKQLSPGNKQIAETLISQLAQQDGITVSTGDEYLPPIDNIPLWLAYMKTENKSSRTIHLYKLEVQNILAAVPKPTSLELQKHFAKRLDTVSPSAVGTAQKAVKSFFKYLYHHGLYSSDPTKDIKPMTGRAREVECPTDEQIMALMRFEPVRKENRARFRLMLFMLIQTGLRIEEACSLRRDWINTRAGELRVVGKGNKERTVPVGRMVAKLLRQFMDKVEPSESPWLFPGNTKSGYWDNSNFRKSLQRACEKLDIKPIHPHQLRHYFATRTLENGAKLEVISKILGHSDVGITAQIYRHINLKEYHSEHDKHNPLGLLPAEPKRLPLGQTEVIEGEVVDG